MSDTIGRLSAELQRISDPAERLRMVAAELVRNTERDEQLRGIRALEMFAARNQSDPPLTWREIGEIFGVTPQRAEAMSKQHTITEGKATP